jgi:small-conductance mechanosensitive channel
VAHALRRSAAALVTLFLLLAAGVIGAQPAAPARPAPPLPDAERILGFLNGTVAWYQRVDAQSEWVDQPTDVLYVNDNRQLARQVVTLTFDSAKAEAQLLAGAATAAPAAGEGTGSERLKRLAKRASTAAEQLHREQTRLGDLQKALQSASSADRPRLDAAVAEAQSRVAMAQARNDAVAGLVGFANDSEKATGTGDLASQIAALEQTVSASAAGAGAVPAAARKPPPSSVIGLIGDLIHLNQKSNALASAIRAADGLQREGRELRAPLMALLTASRQRTDAMMSEPDSNDPAELLRRKGELDTLTARYRQISAAVMPLAKRRILLDAYKGNLTRWRASVAEQHNDELRRLAWRAVALGILLLFVFAVSLTWRRITFRYVPDVKRRHHLLLIRRIVVLLLVAGVLTATFASDFSSLTTFAGLLTAGIAIALQDVILSMAGYFVIIGKYGIRVGDRVRIAAVNGDVLDVGLVWIYLMELETRGSDQLPTGRIVEFPNSVAFDHTAGIFKQLPGTRFLWHEVSLVVPATSDFTETRQKMLGAVESVFADYREAVEHQHRDMDRLLGITTPPPHPHSRLRVSPGGIEIRVRYPVETDNAGETDDRVAAAIAAAVQ